MDTRQWVDDHLVKLAGASDPTTVDFLLATATSAKSAKHLNEQLQDFLDASHNDIQSFSNDLFRRQQPTASTSADKSQSKDDGKSKTKKKYALVDIGNYDEPMPLAPPLDSEPSRHARDTNGSKKRDRSAEARKRERRRNRTFKKYSEAEMEDKYADDEPYFSEDTEPAHKRARVENDAGDNSPRQRSADGDAEEDDEERDQREKDEFEARLRERQSRGNENLAAFERERDDKQDVGELRGISRQVYLKKRESEKLYLLEKQVARQDEEERTNPNLTSAELRDFAQDRELLRLARERQSIDDYDDGYRIPDFLSDNQETSRRHKTDLLHGRFKDKEQHTNDFELWDQEQARKARAAQSVKAEGSYGRAQDYEYVFDTEQAIKWIEDQGHDENQRPKPTPQEQQMQQQLDRAAEQANTIEKQRKALPMYQYRDDLLKAIKEHQVLIVVAETGSGKTTQLPQYLYEAGYAKDGMKIGCTQPRRVAAMSVAARVSEEMGTRLGDKVGYTIRFEDKTSDRTVLKYMTDGMLLREIMQDTQLEGYSAMMIDEAHERTISTDVLFAIIKDIARARPELRLLISSATLNAQKFSEYFDDAPIFSVPGRMHKVDIMYTRQPEANWLAAACTTIFQIHLTQPPGDILLFCTGEEDIHACADNLTETAKKLGNRSKELLICPVYANLPTDMQSKIFEPTPPNTRKVVLATNIAETSLTIDGIQFVIDPGFVKQNVYNPRTGMESLVVVPISRASAGQRAGRAGRTGPGKCFRLFTSWSYLNEMDESTPPEIQRSNLAQVVLLLKSIGINDLISFDFIDAPAPDALMRALEELYMLGALNSRGSLTKIGRAMAELPIAPMMSKSILAADKLKCVEEVITVIAMLGETASLFFRPKDKRIYADSAHGRFTIKDGGDHLTLLNIWMQWSDSDFSPIWSRENFLQQRSLTRARDVREQLLKLCERVEVTPSSAGLTESQRILKAFTSGYFANAARLQKGGDSYRTTKSGITVYIYPGSTMAPKEPRKDQQTGRPVHDSAVRTQPPMWLVYDTLVLTSREYMRGCFELNPEWLVEVAPHYYDKASVEKLGLEDKKKKLPKS